MAYIRLDSIEFSSIPAGPLVATVEFKLATDPTYTEWTDAADVLQNGDFDPPVMITGLIDNELYDIRVTLNCSITSFEFQTTATEVTTTTTSTTTTTTIASNIAYYGWIDDKEDLPSQAEIEASFSTLFPLGGTIIADYTANSEPKYLWMAEPSGEPLKTKWFGTEFNQGDIGNPGDLFVDWVIIGPYRFYYTDYQTQQEDTLIEFRVI